jgi:hypothetical protein
MPGLMIPPKTEQEPITLWTVEDVARFLRCKPKRVYYYIDYESLPYIQLTTNGRYLFDPNDVQAWVGRKRRIGNQHDNNEGE